MINKLVEKIKKTGAPIVVGLDPMLNYIPQHVLDKAFAEYGEINNAWTADDVKGFTKILSMPLKIYHAVNDEE